MTHAIVLSLGLTGGMSSTNRTDWMLSFYECPILRQYQLTENNHSAAFKHLQTYCYYLKHYMFHFKAKAPQCMKPILA